MVPREGLNVANSCFPKKWPIFRQSYGTVKNFINIQLLKNSGQLIIPFRHLEVPLPASKQISSSNTESTNVSSRPLLRFQSHGWAGVLNGGGGGGVACRGRGSGGAEEAACAQLPPVSLPGCLLRSRLPPETHLKVLDADRLCCWEKSELNTFVGQLAPPSG